MDFLAAGIGVAIWKQQTPERDWLPGLDNWFGEPAGRSVLAAEQVLISELLDDSFGYNQLLLSMVPETAAANAGRVQNHFRLGTSLQAERGVAVGGICDLQHLPIENESLDLLVLQHVLEFVENPHALLREAGRVLVPRGRLLIVNFNPLSIWGLVASIDRLRRRSIWQTHFLAANRVADWLGVLDFHTDRVDFVAHRAMLAGMRGTVDGPANRRQRLARRIPLGCSYTLSAVKHRARMTPIRPRWQREPFANVSPIAAARSSASHFRNR